ncbi:hypothetical protein C8A03DRAFT_32025 [Achaetomium macrosporum]|uniref:Uncharacterized protein n=1 Tax=Achaetomium macrosporum TaxID=79813 RepID=A0AAN7CF25_9PEZI|nr:hypothetical protein C8A03DRAFT_32025 [Achaetomium macrosporum]
MGFPIDNPHAVSVFIIQAVFIFTHLIIPNMLAALLELFRWVVFFRLGVVVGYLRTFGRKLAAFMLPLFLVRMCHAAPIVINSTSNPDLLSAVATINASVSHASAQGVIQDTGILDDIERLLNIIGDHVERIRGPYVGNSTSDATYTPNAAYPLTNTTATSTVPVIDAGVAGTKTTKNKSASTTITNPPSFADIFGAANGSQSEKNITVHCKGISVCNPVTVLSDDGTGKGNGNGNGNGNGKDAKKGAARKIG